MSKNVQDDIICETGAKIDNDGIECDCVVNDNNKENEKYGKNTQNLLDKFMQARLYPERRVPCVKADYIRSAFILKYFSFKYNTK